MIRIASGGQGSALHPLGPIGPRPLFLALAFATQVYAQETITVTATRAPAAVEDIAAGVTILDRDTLDARGDTTLVDALAAVPGLRVVQSGGPGSVASVFIRGANSNQVLVLRDGVPINDPADPGGAFNFGIDTIEDLDRIEIVRGPLSAAWGSGAIGGVINLITRRGAGSPQASITLAGGYPRQLLLDAALAGTAGPFDYRTDLSTFSTAGFDQTPQRERIYTGEADGDREKHAEAEIGYTPIAGTRISLIVRGRDSKYGYDELGYDSNNATGYDSSLYFRLGVTSTILPDLWDTTATISRLQDDREYTIRYQPADPNQAQTDDRYHGARTDVNWVNTVHLPPTPFSARTDLVFGYEHTNDSVHTSLDEAYFFSPYLSTTRAHADTDAVWAGLQSTLAKSLAATAQIREDFTTISGNAFTWRLGASYDIPELGTHLKAAYGTSFRAPALFDRYGIDSAGYVGNPNLRAEYAEGWEAGITSERTLGRWHVSMTATYFDTRTHDLITIAFSPVYTSINVNSARAHGVETALDIARSGLADLSLTWTYTDARNLDSGQRLVRRPYEQASADLRLTPTPNLTIVPELLYTGSFEDYLTLDDGSSPGITGLARSGLVFNLNTEYRLTPAIKLFAWGKNLGGSRFEPASGYVLPGPSFLAGVKWSLR